jgi:hypothetical protein
LLGSLRRITSRRLGGASSLLDAEPTYPHKVTDEFVETKVASILRG